MPNPSPSRIFTDGRLIDPAADESIRPTAGVDPSSHTALLAAVLPIEPIGPVTTAAALEAAAALRTDPGD
jgi:hypothetical protein